MGGLEEILGILRRGEAACSLVLSLDFAMQLNFWGKMGKVCNGYIEKINRVIVSRTCALACTADQYQFGRLKKMGFD